MSFLLFGFLVGLRHALEADHLAAVAALATRSGSVTHAVKQGIAWGFGHTVTLFLFGVVILSLDTVIPARLAAGLEFAVGIMLVLLGTDVLRRMYKDRIHFHSHAHDDGTTHFHAHSHAGETGHDPARHAHRHQKFVPLRALFVGLMHGMAGSAALILLTLDSVGSLGAGLMYIFLFSLGSMIGMALLSLVIAVPLRYSARNLTACHNGLQGIIGAATIMLGAMLIYDVGTTRELALGQYGSPTASAVMDRIFMHSGLDFRG